MSRDTMLTQQLAENLTADCRVPEDLSLFRALISGR